MNDEKPLRLRGRCFHNGREFIAQLVVPEGNREVFKTLGGDPHLTATLEEAFNFLLSGDSERVIAGYMNKKGFTSGKGLPYVVVNIAGHKYGLIAAAKQPNAAQLWLRLPFFGSQAAGSLTADEFSESDADNYDMAQAGAAVEE
jgi:hypothetical protein